MPNPEILRTLADNPLLIEALKEVLTKQFPEPADDNGTVSNEILGQQARTRAKGLAAIDAAFKEISRYKGVPDKPKVENPGR